MASSIELEYIDEGEYALLDAAVLEADAVIAARSALAVNGAPSSSFLAPNKPPEQAGVLIAVQSGGLGTPTEAAEQAAGTCSAGTGLLLEQEKQERELAGSYSAVSGIEQQEQAGASLPAQGVGAGQREQQKQNRIAALLQDLEDLGRKHNRRQQRRARGLNVTDISTSEWCQQQVAFSLSARLPKELVETPAMVAGTKQHTLLDAETSVVVDIEVQTREDAFAISMLNTIVKIRQLLTEGMTREVNVFGKLQGRIIRGIVDQLQFDEAGRVCVVEQKTRFQPSLPSRSQKRTTSLQVMLYRQLLEGLASTTALSQIVHFLEELGLDDCRELSDVVKDHANSLGVTATRLPEIAQGLCNAAKALPSMSDTMLVNYIWQGDGELLEQEKVQYDAQFLEAKLTQHLGFWEGLEPPQQVAKEERWKCNRCHFKSKCFPDQVRKVPWAH